jgi:DNA-binding XRE family transcriptional regulator
MLLTVTPQSLSVNPESLQGAEMAPKGTDILSRMQLLAARYAMELTLDQLAELAEIHRATVLKFEQGKTIPTAATARAVRRALEGLGVEFPDLRTVVLPEEGERRPTTAKNVVPMKKKEGPKPSS